MPFELLALVVEQRYLVAGRSKLRPGWTFRKGGNSCQDVGVQAIRETVKSPAGDYFVIAYAPSRGIDTTDLYAGRLFVLRRYAPLIDLIGWIRHRVEGNGQWIVAAAKLGPRRRATEVIHSSYVTDRDAARTKARELRHQLQIGMVN